MIVSERTRYQWLPDLYMSLEARSWERETLGYIQKRQVFIRQIPFVGVEDRGRYFIILIHHQGGRYICESIGGIWITRIHNIVI